MDCGMSEMVDRVARAMAAYAEKLPTGDRDALFIYGDREGLARAAIAALRDPTAAMVDAGENEDDRTTQYVQGADCTEHWRAMIDAALKSIEKCEERLEQEEDGP